MEPQHHRRTRLTLDVVEPDAGWLLPEDDVPESIDHRAATTLLAAILRLWAQRHAPSAVVAENLACRWNPADRRIGVDPDIVFIEPAPDLDDGLEVWRPGHPGPRIAVEIVSGSNAQKDYTGAPGRYSALGARELWIYDPKLYGPRVGDGPFVLQLWTAGSGKMVRIYEGSGPVRSPELGCWLLPTDAGRLRLADDDSGESLWLTEAEEARLEARKERLEARQERQRADAETQRANTEKQRADALAAQVAALQAQLAQRP